MRDILEDVNRVDESGYDSCYLAMKEKDEVLALSILSDKKFDRYHLNEDKSLLSWAIYFRCENVVDILLEDKKMVQLANNKNPYYEFADALTEEPGFLLYMNSYSRIFDKLLRTEEIDFSKVVDACMYFINDRLSKKRFSCYPGFQNYFPVLSFYDEAIGKILEHEQLAKYEISPSQYFGYKSLLYYVVKYGTGEEFKKIMKSGIDINKQFAQDEISNKLFYKEDSRRGEDEWLLDNALTVSLGCDWIYPIANKEDMDFDKFYALIFNQKLDSKYALEAINRICYSKYPLKEELIIKILANREWPKEDIYNKTLLSFAFYGLNKAYRFFLSNPNVDVRTLTLELIHEYARKFHQEEYGPEYKIEKNEEQEKDIEELTMQLLETRHDRIAEEEKLPYELLIFDFCDVHDEFTKNIIEKFQNQKLADEIVMDSWWKIKDEMKVKIRPRLNLPSYRIDHIDKYILQDSEKNQELLVWAQNYTDRLIQEAGYLPNLKESDKIKEKTVTNS